MSEVLRERVLVTGPGAFIGHHLVARLKRRGYWVQGLDLKRSEYTPIDAGRYELLDLRRWDECLLATPECGSHLHAGRRHGRDRIISGAHATILRNTALTNLNISEPAGCRTSRYLFSSSACMYPRTYRVRWM
jgi:GDP-D-mannose 3',5'-epimerase